MPAAPAAVAGRAGEGEAAAATAGEGEGAAAGEDEGEGAAAGEAAGEAATAATGDAEIEPTGLIAGGAVGPVVEALGGAWV